MGKNEDDLALSSLPTSASTAGDGNGGRGVGRCGQCRWIARIVSLRCLAALAVGVAVLLSALFWLPPFLGGAHRDSDPQYGGAVVVASFKVPKPVSLLNANIEKLRYDIFEEIGVVNSSVDVISVEPLGGPNLTNVVFGIWPYPKTSTISSMELSIVRSNFRSFVIRQTTLHLTTSLFGSPFFFQVLKFPGGITIIPQQSVFLLQKVQVLFNFTLNFPIYQVQDKLNELESQMKSGLHLNYNENLYVRLTNLRGSTIAPPTVVQTSVVLAVGNKPPSIPRLRQLAQNIRGSSNGNLGLNHTVFGKVKQIRLSSLLPLNSGGNGISMPPSPAPQPHTEHHNHHYHHHHHHHHHRSDVHFAPAPAPQRPYKSPAPSGCHFATRSNPKIPVHIVPAAAPVDSPHYSPVPPSNENLPSPSPIEDSPSPSPVEDPPAPSQDEDQSAPSPQEDPPAPAPHLLPTPVPHVSFAHARPPSEDLTDAKPPDRMPSISPSPSLSSVAGQPSCCWVLVALLYVLARL